jgi:hypothetical protein
MTAWNLPNSWLTMTIAPPGRRSTCLEGAESRRAARLLAGKHPLLHGPLVPLTHRPGRARTGKSVHFQLTPLDHGQVG